MPQSDMRDTFIQVVSHEWFESSGSVWLEGSSWDEETLRMSLVVEPWEGKPNQKWKITVARAFEERLSGAWSDDVYLGRDHPALIAWTEEEADIYFTANRLPPRELLGIAAAACANIFEDFYPVSRFLNKGLGILSDECGAQGLLGRFPQRVVKEILSAIPSGALQPAILNPRLPSYWDGAEHKPYPAGLEVLAFGDSYVIGEGFTFEQA